MAEIINMKVVGIGGAGCSVVSRMKQSGIGGVSYCAINTDRSALGSCAAEEKLAIGERLTKGQGAGSRPEIGRMAAEESKNAIQKLFEGVDAVFLTAGMGGGTGTGAIPVVAEAARSAGVLTVAVVTMPFRWEGARKTRTADQGIQALLEQVDTLFVIPNDNLKKVTDQKVSLANAFSVSDEVLIRAVGGIADLLRSTGFINLDFADLKTVLRSSGLAHLGIGEASGKSKVEEAAAAVIHSELMDTDIVGARRVIINIIGSPDLPMEDLSAVMDRIQQSAHEDANIIFGLGFDENLMDALRVIVIATDFGDGSFGTSPDREEVAEVVEKQKAAPSAAEKAEKGASDDDWDALWDKFFK
jgi:cell division protein FtsZ